MIDAQGASLCLSRPFMLVYVKERPMMVRENPLELHIYTPSFVHIHVRTACCDVHIPLHPKEGNLILCALCERNVAIVARFLRNKAGSVRYRFLFVFHIINKITEICLLLPVRGLSDFCQTDERIRLD